MRLKWIPNAHRCLLKAYFESALRVTDMTSRNSEGLGARQNRSHSTWQATSTERGFVAALREALL